MRALRPSGAVGTYRVCAPSRLRGSDATKSRWPVIAAAGTDRCSGMCRVRDAMSYRALPLSTRAGSSGRVFEPLFFMFGMLVLLVNMPGKRVELEQRQHVRSISLTGICVLG